MLHRPLPRPALDATRGKIEICESIFEPSKTTHGFSNVSLLFCLTIGTSLTQISGNVGGYLYLSVVMGHVFSFPTESRGSLVLLDYLLMAQEIFIIILIFAAIEYFEFVCSQLETFMYTLETFQKRYQRVGRDMKNLFLGSTFVYPCCKVLLITVIL